MLVLFLREGSLNLKICRQIKIQDGAGYGNKNLRKRAVSIWIEGLNLLKEYNLPDDEQKLPVNNEIISYATSDENDPMLMQDIKGALEIIAPEAKIYHHPDNAHSHIRATTIGPGKTIPIEDGIPILSESQEIIFFEFDIKEREREIIITVIGD